MSGRLELAADLLRAWSDFYARGGGDARAKARDLATRFSAKEVHAARERALEIHLWGREILAPEVPSQLAAEAARG